MLIVGKVPGAIFEIGFRSSYPHTKPQTVGAMLDFSARGAASGPGECGALPDPGIRDGRCGAALFGGMVLDDHGEPYRPRLSSGTVVVGADQAGKINQHWHLRTTTRRGRPVGGRGVIPPSVREKILQIFYLSERAVVSAATLLTGSRWRAWSRGSGTTDPGDRAAPGNAPLVSGVGCRVASRSRGGRWAAIEVAGSADPRHESEAQRDDRHLAGLLQELRVVGLGVQVLFGFVLSMPFTNRFTRISRGNGDAVRRVSRQQSVRAEAT